MEWTPVDGSGFPADPFPSSNKPWPSPRTPHAMHHPERMSDEDWLPRRNNNNNYTNTSPAWGSVEGRSDESGEWQTNPLSPDGFGHHEEPALGSEARPIALDDLVVDELLPENLVAAREEEGQHHLRVSSETDVPPQPVTSRGRGAFFKPEPPATDVNAYINEDPELDIVDDDSTDSLLGELKSGEEKKDDDEPPQSRMPASLGHLLRPKGVVGTGGPPPPPPPPPPPRRPTAAPTIQKIPVPVQAEPAPIKSKFLRRRSRTPPEGRRSRTPPGVYHQGNVPVERKVDASESRKPSPPTITTTNLSQTPWGKVNLRKVDSPIKKNGKPFVKKDENKQESVSAVTPSMAARLRQRQDRKRNGRRNDADMCSESESETEPGPIRLGKSAASKSTTAHSRARTRQSSSTPPPKPRVPPKAFVPKVDKKVNKKVKEWQPEESEVQQAPSGESNKTSSSLQSFGTDIGRLREMRRKAARRSDNLDLVRKASIDYSTPTYDENDPMQRSLLRLLSKQVIIIQCAARRFLALRKTYTRIWAAVEIQAIARRFIYEQRFLLQREAACIIQAVYRGGRVRDQILLEHCCAVEIQRCVRGYLATLEVYEEIYQITLVQSMVRRRQAIDRATDRMVFVIQVQSLARGYLTRKRMRNAQNAALIIQKTWRGSLQRLCYELDLLDVVIVQSVARRFLVRKQIENRHATTIQKTWRSYSCFLAYQIKLFSSITIQALWRGYVARKYYARLLESRRHVAATMIQAQWRSYDCSMNYLHYLADVLAVQSSVRAWIRRKRALKKIQKVSRMFVVRLRIVKSRAAKKIQTEFRQYLNKKALDRLKAACAIQGVWKKFYVKRYARKEESAVVIQKHWRGFLAYADFMFVLADIILVQSFVRRFLAINKRRQLSDMHLNRAASTIQACVHSRYLRRVAAAVLIQHKWRAFISETKAFIEQFENRAATTIQSAWRGYSCFSRYIVALDSAITVQCAFRAYSAYNGYTAKLWAATLVQDMYKKRLAQHEEPNKASLAQVLSKAGTISERESNAVIHIQKLLRGGYTRQAYILFLAARQIQAMARGWRVRKAYVLFMAARKIQCHIRSFRIRRAYILFRAARKIQANVRGSRTRRAYKLYCASRVIQSHWRGSVVHQAYKKFLAARCIQTNFRRSREQARYRDLKENLRNYCAVLLIQACMRRKLARKAFVARREAVMAREIEAAKLIQRNWRGHAVRKTGPRFVKWMSCWQDRRVAAITIQSHWRGFVATENYWNTLGSVILIQSMVRRWKHELRYNDIYGATLVLQSFARVIVARQEMERRRFILSLVHTIQGKDPVPRKASSRKEPNRQVLPQATNWELVLAEQRRLNNAARVIQRFFAMVKKEVDLAIAQKEKKRRKRKKKKKQLRRPANEEDYLLEAVWGKTFEDRTVLIAENGQNLQKPKIPREYTRHSRSLESVDKDGPSLKTLSRVPKSRLGLPTRIIDEDYALETAWMDAEINVAKRRVRGMSGRGIDP